MKTKIYTLLSSAKKGMFVFALIVCWCVANAQVTYTFSFTGTQQTLALSAGTYDVKMWGANGGNSNNNRAGIGGYSNGTLSLPSSTTLYIVAGGSGTYTGVSGLQPGGYNGGGSGYANATGRAGGGATHIATLPGLLSALVSNTASVIMVAGGGGGDQNAGVIGHGGGLSGGGTYPGTQIGSAGGIFGSFGQGGNITTSYGGGAGGGWYGGGGNQNNAGSGGSGYIGGVSNGVTTMSAQPGFVTNPDVAGNGRVIITQLCNIFLGTNSGNNMLCQGAAVTLTTDAISSYTWSTGSNAASILVNPSVTTTYSLTAMSPSLCITSAAITITVSNAAPSLSVSVSSPTVCLGNTVSISASGALTYSFSGGISNGVVFTPSATTAYSIQGQNGCGTASSVTTITIAALPVSGSANPSLVCAGSTASLSGTGATTFTWSPGNIVGTNVMVSPQTSTTYTVVGASGNCLGINTVVVNANPIPTLQVSASNSIVCGGESVTLTASGALGYTWQPGNLIGNSIVVNPSAPTAYVVTGNNSFGCTSTAQQPVIAYASPTIVLNPFTTTICAGGTAIINASGANTYTWSTGPNTSSISVNPTSTTVYTVAGTNTVTQCSSSNTVEVNVFTPNLTVSSPTAICAGSSATLSATGADTYQWSTGGFGPSLVVTPNTTTSYSVTGVANSGNVSCSATATTTVTINPLPVIAAVASRSNICKNESTVLTATGGVSYLWSNSASTASISVSPTINTTFTVEGTNANGCKNSNTIFIRVYACVGINEAAEIIAQLQIFPNPSNGFFTVQSSESIDLMLVNELGQVVKELKLNIENNNSVEVKGLSKGVYFISSKNSNLQLNKKIVVQ